MWFTSFNLVVFIHLFCHLTVYYLSLAQFCLLVSLCLHLLQFQATFLNYNNLRHAHKHTLTLTHAHLLTLILALSSTAECLMTLRGGIEDSSRYNMLDEIQAFSIPRACWKTIFIFIHSGCVWSHKQKQKGIRHTAACNAIVCLSTCAQFIALLYCSRFAFPFHANMSKFCSTLSVWQNTCTDLQSHCCISVSKSLSIHATDLYPSGSGSFDLDKYIQSQETKVIPTLCSLLALDQ